MNYKNFFLIFFLVFLAIGLVARFMPVSVSTVAIVEGIAKGLAGVFFILFYIFMLLGKEPTDKTTH